MDLATIIGLVGGVATIAVVMILDGGSPAELFSVPQAILLIVAGSIASSVISFPLKIATKLPKYFGVAFKEAKFEAGAAIELLATMTDKARREGLLTLEEESRKIEDPFMQKGIMLVVDGVDPMQVRAILEGSIEHMEERHREGIGFFAAAGGFAPTFGIIGTVMGLIGVLKQLDDPKKLAESIAAAFLATLWGLIMANLIYLPIAGKLKARNAEEVGYRRMLMEGILALQAGENPRIVREKLNTFLPPTAVKAEGGEKAAPAGQKAKA